MPFNGKSTKQKLAVQEHLKLPKTDTQNISLNKRSLFNINSVIC